MARRLLQLLRIVHPTLAPLNEWADDAQKETMRRRFTHLFVVTSTCRLGEPPGNASKFLKPKEEVPPARVAPVFWRRQRRAVPTAFCTRWGSRLPRAEPTKRIAAVHKKGQKFGETMSAVKNDLHGKSVRANTTTFSGARARVPKQNAAAAAEPKQ